MSTTDAEFVELLGRLANESVPVEKKHTFVIDLVNSLHKNARRERRPAIKKFLMGALKEFSKSADKKVLRETFPLWLLLAEYSETMGLRKILDNVAHLYKDYVPFYHAYVKELQSKGLAAEALECAKKCQRECKLTDAQLAQEFSDLIVQEEEEEVTSLLFNATVMQARFHTTAHEHHKVTKISEEVTIYQDEIMEASSLFYFLRSLSPFVQELVDETQAMSLPSEPKESPQKPPQVPAKKIDDTLVDPQLSQTFTLKTLSEMYQQKGGKTGALIPFLAACLAEKTEGGRIVRNLKPETIGIVGTIDAKSSPKEQLQKTIIKICQDSTDDADKENAQRMAAGFLKAIGLLLFGGDYEVLEEDGVQTLASPIPRSCLDRGIWAKLFAELLNLPAGQKVEWNAIADRLQSAFLELSAGNKTTWQRSVEDFNGLSEY
ncbi:hypothetical protein M3Y99_00091500 [Aphelenchoides fujianensis]|nr:hypothetical protein M3Y99_00091500 [Aphelenchoides fujianensis]